MFRIPLVKLVERDFDKTMRVGTVMVDLQDFRSDLILPPYRDEIHPKDVVDAAKYHPRKLVDVLVCSSMRLKASGTYTPIPVMQ